MDRLDTAPSRKRLGVPRKWLTLAIAQDKFALTCQPSAISQCSSWPYPICIFLAFVSVLDMFPMIHTYPWERGEKKRSLMHRAATVAIREVTRCRTTSCGPSLNECAGYKYVSLLDAQSIRPSATLEMHRARKH